MGIGSYRSETLAVNLKSVAPPDCEATVQRLKPNHTKQLETYIMTYEDPLVLKHLKKALLQLQSAKEALVLQEMKDSQAYLRIKSAIAQTDWAIQEIEKLQKESGNV